MEERVNLSQDDVLDVIKDFPLEPSFSRVYITLNKLEADGDLVLSDNVLSDIQYVVAKGPMVTWLDAGQKVIIDIDKMMVPIQQESTDSYQTVMQVKIDPIEINGNIYTLIEDRLIKAKDNR